MRCATVLADLKKAGVTAIGAEKEGESLIVRLPDLKSQSAASDALRDTVGEKYTVALNLASTVPDWLARLGGRPMVLGLDLQGGVHFVLQVDQKAALDKRLDAYTEDVRSTCVTPASPTSRWSAVRTTASWPT